MLSKFSAEDIKNSCNHSKERLDIFTFDVAFLRPTCAASQRYFARKLKKSELESIFM